MFKKLFIGLIILSALTAEGTAFFNIALAPLHSCITGLYFEEDDRDQDTGDIPVNAPGLAPVRYGTYAFVSTDEIIAARDNQNVALVFSNVFSSLYYPVIFGQALINSEIIWDNSYILCASDTSPPADLQI